MNTNFINWEQLLDVKTIEQPSSRILYTQWCLAKEYISSNLELISHTFPHYSLHNETHAKAILNNITRIIGADILRDNFTAIDIWLLITSAYYHDLGMVICALDKQQIFEEKDHDKFVEFVKEAINSTSNPIHEFAVFFEIKDGRIYYKNDELSGKSYDAARFILAEYVRRKHAERSHEKILENITLSLPGSPIPSRIISVLAEICRMHTKDFNDVMSLPLVESGIDTTDCHPRYIACLLRMGDLLDLDNNRVSDVLLHTLSSVPLDAIMHKQKHMSMRHIQIDTKQISAHSECEEYEVADLANKWFSWINSELTNQLKNWHRIAPDSSYGCLPTLGELTVTLKGYDTFDGKNRPAFKIDPQKAIELLQGAGLYSEPYQSIRELLQNAVDATYIRIWKSWELNRTEATFGQFEKDCQDSTVEVRIKKIDDSDPKLVYWQIEIQDHGIGMSKDDLEVLANTGSKNKNKLRIVDAMPEWMKPSGTFGIGFQSVFLLAEQVEIETRKLYDNQSYHVQLNNPINKENGAILIKTVHNSMQPFGTTLRFTTKQPRVTGWSVHAGEHMTLSIINSYDFIMDSSLDIAIGKIIDEINNFSYYSYVPIKLYYEDNIIELCHRDKIKESVLYDDVTQIEVAFTEVNYNTLVYYRNQPVTDHRLDFLFLGWRINILGGNAKDILTLDRNKIQSSYTRILRENAIAATIRYLQSNFTHLEIEQKPYASMFLEVYAENLEQKDREEQWKNVQIEIEQGETKKLMSIGEILNSVATVKSTNLNNSIPILEFNFQNDCWKYIQVTNNSIERDVFKFVRYILKSVCKYISYQEDCILLSKDKVDYIYNTEETKLKFMRSHSDWRSSRFCMPCNEKYRRLEVDEIPVVESTFSDFNIEYPIMVSPYIKRFKDDTSMFTQVDSLVWSANEQFYDYIFNHRKNKEITKEEIIQAYEEFQKEYQPIIEKINKEQMEKMKENKV